MTALFAARAPSNARWHYEAMPEESHATIYRPPGVSQPVQAGAKAIVISTLLSRMSAALLALGGLALLFASDVILPRLVPAFPVSGAWLGQLLAAAWLSLAALNWLSQTLLLGGIYSRSVVLANAVHYVIAALVVLKIVTRANTPVAVWLLVVPAVLFAGVYGWLLMRGPIERDIEIFRRSQAKAP